MGRKNNKNQRRSANRSLKDGKEEANINLLQIPTTKTRETNKLDFYKTILIVCEGETEAAYFKALTEILAHRISLKFEILPERTENAYSSLAKLFEVALGKMKENTYYEVWVVTDNDEENAYKLDDVSIERIETLSIVWGSVLRQNQRRNMSVRVDEDEKNRIQYFLHSAEYEAFLQNLFPLLSAGIADIIALTTKKNSFEQIERNRVQFFEEYKKDELDEEEAKHLSNIKIAYSAISFENWLLLHFEYNQHAFYNSREHLHYFDQQSYFGETTSGSLVNRFEKGYYLYDNRERLKSFFEACESKAVPFALHLQKSYAAPLIGTGLKYFEINPYCDVQQLIGSFTNTQFLEVGQLYAEISIEKVEKKTLLLKNLQLQKNGNTLDLRFSLVLKESILSRNIAESISLDIYQTTGAKLLWNFTNIVFNQTVYRKDENILLQLNLPILQPNEFCLFSLDLEKLYPGKGKKLVFYI